MMNHNILVMFRAFLTRFDGKNAGIGRDSVWPGFRPIPVQTELKHTEAQFFNDLPSLFLDLARNFVHSSILWMC